jgi:GTPase Era involved in 16S rRNA processing
MRFFWILSIITIIATGIQIAHYKSLETIIALFIIDLMALWVESGESIKEHKNNLLEKLESIEKACMNAVNSINPKEEQKDILKTLENF